jgi:hypothetical protein
MSSLVPHQINDHSTDHDAGEHESGELRSCRYNHAGERDGEPFVAIRSSELPGTEGRDSTAEKGETVIADGTSKRRKDRNAHERDGKGVELTARKARDESEAEQDCQAHGRQPDIEQAIGQYRLRMPLCRKPKLACTSRARRCGASSTCISTILTS